MSDELGQVIRGGSESLANGQTHHSSLITHHLPLGLITEGSLVEGLKARLDGSASVEDMRAGTFVKIEGEKQDFFCLITDIQLGATDPQALQDPPEANDDLLR